MNSRSVLSNFIWRFLERSGAQIVQLVVSIVLARLLAPTDYGTIALMNVFISVLGIFVHCGFDKCSHSKKGCRRYGFFYGVLCADAILYSDIYNIIYKRSIYCTIL